MILCFVSSAPLTESSSGFTLLGMKEKTAPTVVLPGVGVTGTADPAGRQFRAALLKHALG
jgi:hypothetical protein